MAKFKNRNRATGPTDDGLLEQARRTVLRTWKESRPKFLASLDETDRMRVVAEAAENWIEMRDRLIEIGESPEQADNAALREWVVLPDLGEMEEYETEE